MITLSGNYFKLTLIKKFLLNNAGLINVIIALIVSAVIVLSLKKHKQFIFEKTPNFSVKKETLKKVIPNFVYASILTLIIAILIGYQPFIVTSGSMRPSIEPGAVVLVKNVSFEELKVGDVVTFSKNGKIFTTHQIIAIKQSGTFQKGEIVECNLNGEIFQYEIQTSGGQILTHGTGNSLGTVDPAITYANIKGKVFYCIWYVGLIIVTLKNQILLLIIALGASYFAYRNYLSMPQYSI